jgi:hypothetical protein
MRLRLEHATDDEAVSVPHADPLNTSDLGPREIEPLRDLGG